MVSATKSGKKVEEKPSPVRNAGPLTRGLAKLKDETPESPLKNRVLFTSITPTPSVGKNAPKKTSKNDEKENTGPQTEVSTDGVPEDVDVSQQQTQAWPSVEKQDGTEKAPVQSPELEVPEDFIYEEQISAVLHDIKNMKLPSEVQEGEKEGQKQDAKEVEKEGQKDVNLVEQGGVKQTEEEAEKVVKLVEQVIGMEMGKKEEEEEIRLGDSKDPLFDLCLTPQVESLQKEVREQTSKEVILLSPNPCRAIILSPNPCRAIILSPDRNESKKRAPPAARKKALPRNLKKLKSVPKEGDQVIVVSSQEKAPVGKKKGQKKRRVRVQRRQPKRNVPTKTGFAGQLYISEAAMDGSQIPFSDWIGTCLDVHGIDEIDDIPFKYFEDNVSWNYYTDSCFIDPGSLPLTEKLPLADKNWAYDNRDNVSDLVSNILDAWVTKYFQYQIGDDDYVFKNQPADLMMSIDCFRDLLFCDNDLGSEVRDLLVILLFVCK